MLKEHIFHNLARNLIILCYDSYLYNSRLPRASFNFRVHAKLFASTAKGLQNFDNLPTITQK